MNLTRLGLINIDDYEKKICFLFKHVFAAVSFAQAIRRDSRM